MSDQRMLRFLTPLSWTVILLALGACAAPPVPVHHASLGKSYHNRHCLRGHQEGAVRQLQRTNVLSFTHVFPPGKKVDISMYSATQIDMTVDGIMCKMISADGPFPTTPDGIDGFLQKHFSTDEVVVAIEDESLRDQVMSGVAPIGATKEQVLIALGYPYAIDEDVPAVDLDHERVMKSNHWIYRYSTIVFFPVAHAYQFDNKGTLVNVVQ